MAIKKGGLRGVKLSANRLLRPKPLQDASSLAKALYWIGFLWPI
jgi:hypothetical protein